MPTIKLTETTIERTCKAENGKQVLYWDTETKGLGVLVSGSTGTKTFVTQHKLADGRTRRVSIGPVAMGLKKARIEAAQHIAEMLKGNDPKAEKRKNAGDAKRTLRAAFGAYLETKGNLASRSRDGYRGIIERHFADWLDRPLKEITAEVVLGRYGEIQRAVKKPGRSGGGENTGVATANAAMRALRAVYNHATHRARRDGQSMPSNPVSVLNKAEDDAWVELAPRERFLSGDQLPIFYAALDKLKERTQVDYIRLLLFTGLRRTSAAALRWEQVDFASGVIRLPRKQMKGGKRGLDLPMTDYVRDLLVARRVLGNDGGWVFGADSQSGHIEEPRFAFEQVAKLTGITMSAHDMKRTYTTHAEEADISAMALKALVSHAIGGKDVTEGYVRMTTARLREPAQRICDRLKMLCNIAPLPEGVEKIA